MDGNIITKISEVEHIIQYREPGWEAALAWLRGILDGQEKEKKKRRELISLLLCKTSFSNASFLYCFDTAFSPEREDPDEKRKARQRIQYARSFVALGSMADCIQLHRLGEPDDILEVVFEENNWVSTRLDGSVLRHPHAHVAV